MSEAPRYIPHYTLADFRMWEGRWELIDGLPIAMTPSPFGHHERIISRLSFEIQLQHRSGKCQCEVYTSLDWIISEDTIVRPDLMVICGEQPKYHLEEAPALVVEVLSDSTKGRDLVVKRALYNENGVPHYLIIDPENKTIEHVAGGSSSMCSETSQLELNLGNDQNCRIKVECAKLFD
jgi:Uma2 family endonuclease